MSSSCYWLLRSNPSPFELVFARHLNLSPASVVASSRGRDLSRTDAQRRLSLRRRAPPRWRVTPLRPGLRPGTQAGRAPSGATIPVGEISWIRNREPGRFPGPSTSARTVPQITPEEPQPITARPQEEAPLPALASLPPRNAKSYTPAYAAAADPLPGRCSKSGVADGPGSWTVSQYPRACKHKRSSVGAVDQTAGVGANQSRRRCSLGGRRARWLDGTTSSDLVEGTQVIATVA